MMVRTATAQGSVSTPLFFRFQRALHHMVLICCTLAVYGQTLGHDFLTWDDELNFTENPYLDQVSWESVAHFWRETYFSRYMPVSFMLYCAEARLAQYPA